MSPYINLNTIPEALLTRSGRVFYCGRKTLLQPTSKIYLLGLNPGGDPDKMQDKSIKSDLIETLNKRPENYSAYLDDNWEGRPKGQAPLQRRVSHLFRKIDRDLRETLSSNLIFARSRIAGDISIEFNYLAEQCWPMHEMLLRQHSFDAIVCLGHQTADFLAKKLGPTQTIATFTEANNRGWKSRTYATAYGPTLLSLTHPGRANWLNPSADPSNMVSSVLTQ